MCCMLKAQQEQNAMRSQLEKAERREAELTRDVKEAKQRYDGAHEALSKHDETVAELKKQIASLEKEKVRIPFSAMSHDCVS